MHFHGGQFPGYLFQACIVEQKNIKYCFKTSHLDFFTGTEMCTNSFIGTVMCTNPIICKQLSMWKMIVGQMPYPTVKDDRVGQ